MEILKVSKVTLDIKSEKSLGKIKSLSKAVSNYKSEPGNSDYAIIAAGHYAKKAKEPMLVIAGNSYGSRVFHIVRETLDAVTKTGITLMTKEFKCFRVNPDLDVELVKISLS